MSFPSKILAYMGLYMGSMFTVELWDTCELLFKGKNDDRP